MGMLIACSHGSAITSEETGNDRASESAGTEAALNGAPDTSEGGAGAGPDAEATVEDLCFERCPDEQYWRIRNTVCGTNEIPDREACTATCRTDPETSVAICRDELVLKYQCLNYVRQILCIEDAAFSCMPHFQGVESCLLANQ
jgi:hypothetical protein